MADYNKITDFAAKDSMLSGNPLKEITGTAHDNEYNAIAIAIATKLNNSVTLAQLNTAVSDADIGGLGTANTWSAAQTLSGATLNEAEGAAIASAATVNLDSATGNFIHITGTTTITGITLAQGSERTIVFDGVLSLTHSSALILPTEANITTAVGDCAVFRGEGASVTRCVGYLRANGTALSKDNIAIASGTADALTADFVPNASTASGVPLYVRAAAANATTTPTFSADGGTARTIVKGNNLPLVAGDIAGAGHWLELQYDTTLTKYVLQNPATGIAASVAFASAAENIAGTVENKAVDPLGIREAFNATGTAPVYACRAWVNFNGSGAVPIRASGNVSSITDNGVGDYTVNFTTAMQDASYSVIGSALSYELNNTTPQFSIAGSTTGTVITLKTATQVRVVTAGVAGNYDVSDVNVAIFR